MGEKIKKGKGGQYLGKENICFVEEKQNREREGEKYLEKENIWYREKKRNGEGKYLWKEICLIRRKIRKEREKKEILWRRKTNGPINQLTENQPTNQAKIVKCAFLKVRQ